MLLRSQFPLVRQHDAMQCGIACLAMICRYHGRDYSLEALGRLCHATSEGVSLLGVSEAADRLGLRSVAGTISIDDLAKVPLPCILHWNQNHFVVLYRIKGNKQYYIADPGKGLLKYTCSQLKDHWESTREGNEPQGVAMFFEPTHEFASCKVENGKSRDERRSWKFLAGYFIRYRSHFALIVAGLLLGCVLQLIIPFLTQAIVDRGIHKADMKLIWLILLGELMIVFGRTATDFLRRWLLLHISIRVNVSLVSDFLLKLMRLPMDFFDTKQMGDLLQRMSDHQRVQSFLTSQAMSVIFSLLSFIVFGIVLLFYNPLIFGVFVAGSIVYAIWIALFLSRRKIIDYELFEQQSINHNRTYRMLTSMQEIKLQNCERRRRWEWEDTQADLFAVQLKEMKMRQTMEAGSIFISEIKNILITVFAATAVINGDMTLGAMLAIQYIIGQLNSPVMQLMGFIYTLQDVKISLERINEIHCAPEEGEERSVNSAMNEYDDSSTDDILVKDIRFRYDRHDPRMVINDMSIRIAGGDVTAIVGASGSGKTTLLKLLLGFYPVEGGAIYADGKDLNSLDMHEWRKRCGVVMQDGVIFSESVARNIAVDDGPIDIDRLEKAARIACIHDFIQSLPLKYNTEIGPDGTGLSQGQKQRILIARAVYKNPEYILLDEATNSLDATNERSIVDNLAEFFKGRTVIIVAHRLSTVRHADNIVVMDHGKVVETGTHEELTRLRGAYYNLVKNQLELGI